MKMMTTKVISLACVLSAPFLVNASEKLEENSLISASTQPKNKIATSFNEMPSKKNTDNSSLLDNPITPAAGPLVSNGADVYITADFLWWKAKQEGLDFAYTGTTSSHTQDAKKGHMYAPHFKYEPGFKVGFGVLSGHDNWDFFAQYTWLNVPTSDTRKTVHFKGQKLNAVQLQGNGENTLSYYNYEDEVSSTWDFKLNMLDLEMGRDFWISKRITLRPHLGMKFSWIKQVFKTSGKEARDPNQNPPVFASVEKDYNLSQFGVGIRGGINTAFYLWNKWSIFGDIDWTALWNDFKSSHHTSIKESVGAPSYTNTNVYNKRFTMTGVLEASLGLRFETIFNKGKYMYMLQAGWETQIWFNQGNFFDRVNFNNPANLTVEGLTIKTGFWF